MRRSLAPSAKKLTPTLKAAVDGDEENATERNKGAIALYRNNAKALSQGDISVVRTPFLSILTCPGTVRQAFRPPGGAKRTGESDALLRKKSLGVRKAFIPIHSSLFRPPVLELAPAFDLDVTGGGESAPAEAPKEPEPGVEPLVLWQSEPDANGNSHSITVDPQLCVFLRPHQREGVRFMFECLMGLRSFEGHGCILADDMGLGKTLQSIAVMWTLLQQGMEKGKGGIAKRCIVVCPTSLVGNWQSELEKWLKGACKCIALSETSRDQVISSINLFLASQMYKVLIVSYDTFRLHQGRFDGAKAAICCDLLICDEAHRLKNGDTATSKALAKLRCRRRVLLSGTPLQNDLEEFYAMVDFTNPGVLGDQQHFRRHFVHPILHAREPDATESQRAKALERQGEMSSVVNEFILRRTNTLNAKHLPPKLVQVVACRLTSQQLKIYRHLLSSKEIRHILNGKQTNVLSSIGNMQKLCNHPKLLTEFGGGGAAESLAQEVSSILSPGGNSGRDRDKAVHPEMSGKMETLFRLMSAMRRDGDERIVVVSNYTSALDLIGQMCRENNWPFLRLDGSTGASKRKKLVDVFNDPMSKNFAFLLSSKAGGCGLNLIGASRLVLFDPDWNPAVDKQAAARVWRDGQKRRCFVYRFVTTGTIEEKIYQRQLSKEGLQSIVDDQAEVNTLSSKELRDLFRLAENTPCDTHDRLRCKRCKIGETLEIVRRDEEAAERVSLPRQLALCSDLLKELMAMPVAAPFHAEGGLQAEPAAQTLPPGAFEERCGNADVRDLGKVATKLQAGLATALALEQGDAPPAGPQGYSTMPAIAKDIETALSIPYKVWGRDMGGEHHPLVSAAASIKYVFDSKWKDLVPRLMACKHEARQIVKQKREELEAAEEGDGEAPQRQLFQEQIGMPKEEDLNSWSHHFTTDTVDDPVFRKAMAGTGDTLVSFVFGLEVTWDLLQVQMAEEEAAKALAPPKAEKPAEKDKKGSDKGGSSKDTGGGSSNNSSEHEHSDTDTHAKKDTAAQQQQQQPPVDQSEAEEDDDIIIVKSTKNSKKNTEKSTPKGKSGKGKAPARQVVLTDSDESTDSEIEIRSKKGKSKSLRNNTKDVASSGKKRLRPSSAAKADVNVCVDTDIDAMHTYVVVEKPKDTGVEFEGLAELVASPNLVTPKEESMHMHVDTSNVAVEHVVETDTHIHATHTHAQDTHAPAAVLDTKASEVVPAATKKKRKKAEKGGKVGEWQCHQCTFINQGSLKRCNMCNEKRKDKVANTSRGKNSDSAAVSLDVNAPASVSMDVEEEDDDFQ